MHARQPYSGDTKKLVLGLDMGTTYSGVSYAILEPGEVPEIRGVTRFPAQEHVGGDSKVPSILYYDDGGQVRAIGAEALQERIIEEAEDEGWIKVEWFKLHLRPRSVDTEHMKALALPPSISVVTVYADFLHYLFQCTRRYIEETHTNGESLWLSLEESTEFVITHPNGWEGPQQALIRQAAVQAGIVSDIVQGRQLIQFLTEGEASLHFCIQNGLGSSVANTGEGVIIVDAGGGTIDVSAFAANSPTSFEEISAAQCRFQGSVFVTRRAHEYLEEKFKNSKFRDDVATMAEVFDKTSKLRFRSEDEASYIKFGGIRDKDASLNIRAGQLMLEGTTVADFFKPSLDAIIDAIFTQREKTHKPISNVFLVGGFAASDYLYTTLQAWLRPLGVSISRPDSHVNKAVADGAVSFLLDHFVTSRVARFSFGVRASILYDPLNPQHMGRRRHVYKDETGQERLPDSFFVVLQQGTQVTESQSFAKSLYQVSYAGPKEKCINSVVTPVMAYRGNMEPHPKWLDVDIDNFFTYCSIKADLTLVAKPARKGAGNKQYHRVDYDVNIVFGPAEMNAYLSWIEDGVTHRGPAEIIYESDC